MPSDCWAGTCQVYIWDIEQQCWLTAAFRQGTPDEAETIPHKNTEMTMAVLSSRVQLDPDPVHLM